MHGASDWDHQIHVNHPSSDDLVLSCGGTQIDPVSGKDVVWNDNTPFDVNVKGGGGWASGGGISEIFLVPDYQSDAKVFCAFCHDLVQPVRLRSAGSGSSVVAPVDRPRDRFSDRLSKRGLEDRHAVEAVPPVYYLIGTATSRHYEGAALAVDVWLTQKRPGKRDEVSG